MIEPGLLFVLSGPSGVGKDTILHLFLEKNPRCALSVSATTRSPRPGETNGRDYHFLSREAFAQLVEKGNMLEYAEYSGNCYGTPRQAVEEQLAQGRDVILEIEVQGAMQIRAQMPEAVFVFIAPPTFETLCTRLQNRNTEDADSLKARLAAAADEMRCLNKYDYVIINDVLEEAVEELSAVVRAARCTVKHKTLWINEVCKCLDLP